MSLTMIRPRGWPRPKGYSDGVIAPPNARAIFVAGEIAWDHEKHALVGKDDFAAQFKQALRNVLAVVHAAGGVPQDVASMTIFVTDKRRYLDALKPVGAAWRAVMGKHYPAIALVEVAGLLEPGALVEIQAIAAMGARAEPKTERIDAGGGT